MDKLLWYLLWHCRRYAGIAANVSLRGPTSPTILGAGVLGAFMEWQGHAMTFAEGWKGVVAAGVAYTAIAWLTIFVFRLLFVAPFQLWKGGRWLGQEFVYNAPVLAFHRKVAHIDNDKVHKFQFRDAPPFSLIRYTIEVAGREELIAVTVDAHPQ